MADGTIKILTDLSADGFKKGLSELNSIAKTGLQAVTGVIAGTATAIGALGIASTKVGATFETSMAKASTMFGEVKVDANKLESSVIKLSSATGIASETIGNSLYNALSAGIPVTEDMSEAMDYMSKSANLAQAGFTDIDTAVTATAKVLNAYKMDVSETDRVHKILMQTQNNGITTVGELGSVLAQVTPTASAMNVAFEQVGASLATMTAQGTPTAQATTQLNTLFAELGKQGTTANKALLKATEGTKYAGKGFSDLMAEGVPLNEVLDLMGVNAEMSDQSLIDMFGSIEAGKAALALSGQNAETYTKNLEAMSTSADVVGDAVEKMDDTLEVRTSKMIESVKNLGINVYNSMELPLKSAVEMGTGYIGELNTAFETGLDSGVAALGTVFADITVKAAEQAPAMIDAGVNLLTSFLEGLEKNSSKIVSSAVKIGKALLNGLTKFVPQIGKIGLKIITEFAKQLFGTDIAKQVEKLGKAIETGFNKIVTAVQKASSKIAPAMKKVGDSFLSVATGAITVLCDAISFVVENCDILIPVLASVAGAMVGWSIFDSVSKSMAATSAVITAFTAAVTAEGIATASSTVSISLKQVAVGVLSGQIGLVTAAQWLWNTAMSANPIGIVIVAVAALAAGIAALTLMQKDEITAEERLAEANSGLAKVYANSLSKFGEYTQGISGATSILDTLNKTVGISSEKQQELTTEMETCQGRLNEIVKIAAEGRRQLTEDEIQELENLIDTMNSIAEEQLNLQKSLAQATRDEALATARSSQMSAEEYSSYSQSITKTAQETRDSVIDAATRQCAAEIANWNQLVGTGAEYTQQWHDDQVNTSIATKLATIDAANTQMNETNAILAEGYAFRATDAQNWIDKSAQYNQAELELKKKYNSDVEQAWKKYHSITDKGSQEAIAALRDAQDLETSYTEKAKKDIAKIREDKLSHLKNTSSDEIATLTEMVSLADGQYDNLNEGTRAMVDQYLLDLAALPEPARLEMNETLDGMNLEITEGGKLIHKNGEQAGQELIDGWSDKNQDIIKSVQDTVDIMNKTTTGTAIKSPELLPISNAEDTAYTARKKVVDIFSEPVYQSVYITTYESTLRRTGGDQGSYAKGGVSSYAQGGITKYASGGVSPKISKHAAGVFTKRTRLWDPVTGINEYGEAGHEALLPLKTSVFDEIAQGIVRQLSPAKLAGMMSQLKSAVQSEMSNISLQMTVASDYRSNSTAIKEDNTSNKVLDKLDAVLDKLEKLSNLNVLMDSEKVGKLVTVPVNEGLGDIYDTEERVKF